MSRKTFAVPALKLLNGLDIVANYCLVDESAGNAVRAFWPICQHPLDLQDRCAVFFRYTRQ